MTIDFEWYKLLIPLAAGAIGFLFRYMYDKKKELQAPVNIARRDVYKKFIDMVVDDFKGSNAALIKAQEELLTNPNQEVTEALLYQRAMEIKLGNMAELDAKMYNFYVDYMLYASPDVIKAFGDYRQYNFGVMQSNRPEDQRIHMQYLAKIIYEMRDDLGLQNKGLGKYGEETLRGLLMDYQNIFN